MAIDPLDAKVAALKELARRSLSHFVKQSWHVIEPGTPLVWSWVMQLVCDHVQEIATGKSDKNNLIVNIPPGYSKSTIISVCLPAWLWLNRPETRMICVSGSQDVALRDSMKCREILKSDWYKSFGCDWDFAEDQDAKGLFKNTRTGFRSAKSAGARITGDRADLIIVDDPNDAQQAMSEAHLSSIRDWWDIAAANRLSDMRTGKRIIIQQRLAEGDLTGHCLSKQPGEWQHLRLRQTAEHDDVGRIVGDHRNVGDLLCPERFPKSVLNGERARMGSMAYSGQHQQNPVPADGAIFKQKWFKRWLKETIDGIEYIVHGQTRSKASECSRFICADTASSTKTTADNTALCDCLRAPNGDMIVLAVYAGRWEVPETRARIMDIWNTGNIDYVGIETAQAGIGIIQDLTNAGVLVRELKADKDKLTRSVALQILAEQGRVYIPDDSELIHELLTFPLGKHDDRVDACVYAALQIKTASFYCGNSFGSDGKGHEPTPPTYAERIERMFA